MLHKGSKCKCKITDEDIYTRNEKDFDEISMNSSQDHEIDNQLKLKNMNSKQGNRTPYCSSFCKKIGPKDQRNIILECLRIDTNDIQTGSIFLNMSDDPTNLNQLQEIEIKCSANKLKRYIVDAKWWAKWCDYTNFDQSDLVLSQLQG